MINTLPHPLVSAIIPVYNRASCIARAVNSVLLQDYPSLNGRIELIITDDGSTDDTLRILESLQSSTSIHSIPIHILRQSNQGVSAARNRAIEASHGDFIALLDSDDEWRPSKISRQVEQMLTHPELSISQTGETWIRRGVRVNSGLRHQKFAGMIFEKCLELCLISPSAVIMRRSLLDEVGFFDESYPACEDYEMWLRITCNHEVGLIADPLMTKYGGHADQLSATVEALDRWRIKAICKTLENSPITHAQREAALRVLKAKCAIYIQGCIKRGRIEEAKEIQEEAGKYC